ncbi:MAG TPA: hypothetical protein PK926_06805 [Spirochaetota bacterium]|nr:hypothetical protein [Spirochaetota bacterium]HPI90040.1 hypothetical protein [Spirochaetota bacterium]HPR48078.1 hypothetical protein [Spirochaetota bacterium]
MKDNRTINLLGDIYNRTRDGSFMTLDELETDQGKSGSQLRPMLEDLKEEGLIVEHEEGFQVSRPGVDFCRSRWA